VEVSEGIYKAMEGKYEYMKDGNWNDGQRIARMGLYEKG
jgi:hypothetical protein